MIWRLLTGVVVVWSVMLGWLWLVLTCVVLGGSCGPTRVVVVVARGGPSYIVGSDRKPLILGSILF